MKSTIAFCLAGTLLAACARGGEAPFHAGLRLGLPFDQMVMVDGTFVDPATGVKCAAAGTRQIHDGGVLASRFTTLSVPDIDFPALQPIEPRLP